MVPALSRFRLSVDGDAVGADVSIGLASLGTFRPIGGGAVVERCSRGQSISSANCVNEGLVALNELLPGFLVRFRRRFDKFCV